MDIVQAPVDALREIHIVDTPGTNAIFREHEAITADFVPRADFVLFVTSADRPFTETERAFLEEIREWGKKIVLVINKADILETPEDLATVEQFVRRSALTLLGVEPAVFAVSARRAFRAKTAGGASAARESFDALEQYLGDHARRAGTGPAEAAQSAWRGAARRRDGAGRSSRPPGAARRRRAARSTTSSGSRPRIART